MSNTIPICRCGHEPDRHAKAQPRPCVARDPNSGEMCSCPYLALDLIRPSVVITDIPAEWVEAIECELRTSDLDGKAVIRAALSAALPLIERALKAEALREAANDLMRQGIAATPRWLRDRADALEES